MRENNYVQARAGISAIGFYVKYIHRAAFLFPKMHFVHYSVSNLLYKPAFYCVMARERVRPDGEITWTLLHHNVPPTIPKSFR